MIQTKLSDLKEYPRVIFPVFGDSIFPENDSFAPQTDSLIPRSDSQILSISNSKRKSTTSCKGIRSANEPSCGRCRLRRLKTQHRIHVTNHISNLLLQSPACLFPVINRHLIPTCCSAPAAARFRPTPDWPWLITELLWPRFQVAQLKESGSLDIYWSDRDAS